MRRTYRIAILDEIDRPQRDQKDQRQAAGEARQVERQLRARSAIGQPAHGEHQAKGRRHGHDFERDRCAHRHGCACQHRPSPTSPCDKAGCSQRGHRDLPAVMIEHPRLHLAQDCRQEADGDCGEAGSAQVEQPRRAPADGGHGQREHAQRHYDLRGEFRARLPEDRSKQRDHGEDRKVDQPRPVHRHPIRGRKAVLAQIEPALAGNQVAHLYQPQRIVAADGLGRQLIERGDERNSRDQQPSKRDTQRQRTPVDGAAGHFSRERLRRERRCACASATLRQSWRRPRPAWQDADRPRSPRQPRRSTS